MPYVAERQNVTDAIQKLKVEFGAAGQEAGDAAVTFARFGLSQQQTISAVRASLLAANVAGVSAGQAAVLLASSLEQFERPASSVLDLLNKLNTLENSTRTTTNDLLQSISRGGAVFREAGGSLEEYIAITSTVAANTGRTGSQIGNAFKTIASRISDARVQAKVFEASGVGIQNAFGELKPINDLLGDLVVAFENMSAAEQAATTKSIAGVNQRNILQAALDGFFQSQASVIRQFTQAGSAEAENALVLETVSKKTQQLVAAFERLAVTIGESGVGKAFKAMLDLLRGMVDGLASLGTTGALIVGMFAAYAVAVSVAALQNTRFGLSFAPILKGISTVNGGIASFVAALNAGNAASARTISVNGALAASYGRTAAAAGASGAAGAGAVSGAAAGAAGGFASKAAATVGAALTSTIGAAVVAITGAFVAGGVSVSKTLGSGESVKKFSDRFEAERKSATESKTNAQNAAEGLKERIRLAEVAERKLRAIEDAEAAGGRAGASSNRARQQIQNAFLDALELEEEVRQRITRGELTSADAQKIKNDLVGKEESTSQRIVGVRNQEIAVLRRQLFEVNTLAARQELLSKRSTKGGAEGTFLRVGNIFTGDPAKAAREARVEAEALTKQIRELEQTNVSEVLSRGFNQLYENLENTKKILDEIKEESQTKFFFDVEFATDDVERIAGHRDKCRVREGAGRAAKTSR